jgi:DNA-binding CsgD family transcriptional regulator
VVLAATATESSAGRNISDFAERRIMASATAHTKTSVTRISEKREAIRSAIQAAHGLAIANHSAEAIRALAEIEKRATSYDDELKALYFQAYAIAKFKVGLFEDAFKSFDNALRLARNRDESRLLLQILNNYGTSLVHVGDIDLAIDYLGEALSRQRREGTLAPSALVGLAEAFFGGGQLERCAALLREFFSLECTTSAMAQCDIPRALFVASAIGIPVSVLLNDKALLRLTYNPALLDLAFARTEQWILGPLVEAHCALYEYEGRRREHDALLIRAIIALSSLDNSLQLGVRVARLAPPSELPRVSTLMRKQCFGASPLLRAYESLLESFIAGRRSMKDRAQTFALKAVSELERINRPLEYAFALDAAGLAEDARSIRARCGATVRSLRPRWPGLSIPKRLAERLTQRESQIARLAERGVPNKSIARLLEVSERTVQHHCESIFAKLGVHSRWQLSALLSVETFEKDVSGQIAHALRRTRSV